MKPVTTTTTVAAPIEHVFELLLTLGNHERFTDHALVDWELSGPAKGVGAKARVHTTGMGPADTGDIEIVAVDEHDWHITERATGAGGARRTTGTYALFPIADSTTEVRFTIEFERLPARERAMGPLLRKLLQRLNQRSLDRLAAMYASTPKLAAAA